MKRGKASRTGGLCFDSRKLLILMVARDGIEPPSPAFSGPRSTMLDVGSSVARGREEEKAWNQLEPGISIAETIARGYLGATGGLKSPLVTVTNNAESC